MGTRSVPVPAEEGDGPRKSSRRLEFLGARTVSFSLDVSDLAFYTANGVWEAEPGDFEVFVGTSSEEVKSARFTLR